MCAKDNSALVTALKLAIDRLDPELTSEFLISSIEQAESYNDLVNPTRNTFEQIRNERLLNNAVLLLSILAGIRAGQI